MYAINTTILLILQYCVPHPQVQTTVLYTLVTLDLHILNTGIRSTEYAAALLHSVRTMPGSYHSDCMFAPSIGMDGSQARLVCLIIARLLGSNTTVLRTL